MLGLPNTENVILWFHDDTDLTVEYFGFKPHHVGRPYGVGPLLLQHGMSSDWRRQPPDMEGSCEYIV
jgi:hypothetical protein